MKVATTIQITAEENREITHLRDELHLPTKKAVVLEGLQALRRFHGDQKRRRRLQKLSHQLRSHSGVVNREWAPLSSALRKG